LIYKSIRRNTISNIHPAFESVFMPNYWTDNPSSFDEPEQRTERQFADKQVASDTRALAGLAALAILNGQPRTRLAEDEMLGFDETDPNTQPGTVLLVDMEMLLQAKRSRRKNTHTGKSCKKDSKGVYKGSHWIEDEDELAMSPSALFRMTADTDSYGDINQIVTYPYRGKICNPAERLHYLRDVRLAAYTFNKSGGVMLRAIKSYEYSTDGVQIVGDFDLVGEGFGETVIPSVRLGETYASPSRHETPHLIRFRAAEVCINGLLEYFPEKAKKSPRFKLSPATVT
jgi:hypothetical protein